MLQFHRVSPSDATSGFSYSSVVRSPAQVSRGHHNPVVSRSGLLPEGLVRGRISAFSFCPFRPLTKFSSVLWPYRGPCRLRDVPASRSHRRSLGAALFLHLHRQRCWVETFSAFGFSPLFCRFTDPRAVLRTPSGLGLPDSPGPAPRLRVRNLAQLLTPSCCGEVPVPSFQRSWHGPFRGHYSACHRSQLGLRSMSGLRHQASQHFRQWWCG